MKRRARKMAVLIVPFAILAGIALCALAYRTALAKGEAEKNEVIEKTVSYLKGKNIDMGADKLKKVVHSVYKESQQCDLDYRLALAVIKVESNFKQDVVSNKGARGLFQIKPSLAKYIAKDAGVTYDGNQCLHEPEKNIKLGVYHLSKLVEDFKNLPTALHAYNAGESRLKARPSKKEPTTTFTKRVMKEYENNLSILPDAGEPDR
jgi:soluble lytic murein transglycosylase